MKIVMKTHKNNLKACYDIFSKGEEFIKSEVLKTYERFQKGV